MAVLPLIDWAILKSGEDEFKIPNLHLEETRQGRLFYVYSLAMGGPGIHPRAIFYRGYPSNDIAIKLNSA